MTVCARSAALVFVLASGAVVRAGDEAGIPAIVRDLESSDAKRRGKAADELQGLVTGLAFGVGMGGGDREKKRARLEASPEVVELRRHVDVLVRVALRSADRSARQAAAMGVSVVGEPATDGLVAGLEEGSPEARAMAAKLLAPLPPARVVDPLVKACADRELSVRRAALDALGEVLKGKPAPPEEARVVGALLDALADAAPEVRKQAGRALGRLEWARPKPPLPAAGRERLLALAKHTDAGLRATALTLVRAVWPALLEEPAVREALAKGLTDGEAQVRSAAVELAATLPPAERLAALTPRLTDEDADLARRAREHLGQVGLAALWGAGGPAAATDPAARATLVAALVEASRRSGDEAPPAGLPEATLGWLHDPSPAVRADAARLAARLNAQVLGAGLVAVTRDPDARVREQVVVALATKAGAYRGAPATEVGDALLAALQDDDPAVRRAAARGLAGGRVPAAAQAVEALAAASDDADPAVRKAVEEALDRRGAAGAAALARHRAAPASPAASSAAVSRRLVDALASADPAAVEAVVAAGPTPEIVQALVDVALTDGGPRPPVLEALNRLGPPALGPAVERLAAALGDARPEVACAAARALRQLGPSAAPATPALVKALESTAKTELWSLSAGALAAVGSGARAALPALLARARRDATGVAAGAAARVGAGQPDDVDLLLAALKDEGLPTRGRGELVEGLLPCAPGAAPRVVAALVEQLDALPGPVVEALGRLDAQDDDGALATSAAKTLVARLAKPDPRHALTALANLGTYAREGAPHAARLLVAPGADPKVAEEAIDLLRAVGPYARPHLKAITRSVSERRSGLDGIVTLSQLGALLPEARAELLAFGQANPEARLSVVISLEMLGGRAADCVAGLERWRRDPDGAVVTSVEQALEKIRADAPPRPDDEETATALARARRLEKSGPPAAAIHAWWGLACRHSGTVAALEALGRLEALDPR